MKNFKVKKDNENCGKKGLRKQQINCRKFGETNVIFISNMKSI